MDGTHGGVERRYQAACGGTRTQSSSRGTEQVYVERLECMARRTRSITVTVSIFTFNCLNW